MSKFAGQIKIYLADNLVDAKFRQFLSTLGSNSRHLLWEIESRITEKSRSSKYDLELMTKSDLASYRSIIEISSK